MGAAAAVAELLELQEALEEAVPVRMPVRVGLPALSEITAQAVA